MGVSISVGIAVVDHRRLLFLIVHGRGRRRGRGLLKHRQVLWGWRRRWGGAVCDCSRKRIAYNAEKSDEKGKRDGF